MFEDWWRESDTSKSKIIIIVGVPMHRLSCRKFHCGQMHWLYTSLSQYDARSQYSSLMSYESTNYMDRAAKIHLSDVYKFLGRWPRRRHDWWAVTCNASTNESIDKEMRTLAELEEVTFKYFVTYNCFW